MDKARVWSQRRQKAAWQGVSIQRERDAVMTGKRRLPPNSVHTIAIVVHPGTDFSHSSDVRQKM